MPTEQWHDRRVTATTEALKWWERLPADFYRQADGTPLDAEHRFKVRATAAIDIALRTFLATVVGAASLPRFITPGRVRRQMEQMRVHEALADAGNAEAVFRRPELKSPVRELRPRLLSYRPLGVEYRLLRFDSRHDPLNPDVAPEYHRCLNNQHAYAQYWFHRDGPRPTLIMIHGFGVDAYWFNAQMFSLRWFYQQGYDILLYTLPFHGYRVERSDWFSGYRLFAGGLPCFNEAIVHAVRDLRVFMDYLQRRGVRHMGVSGLSLGGYTSALLACVEDRLSFCIPNSPVVSIVDIAREWQPMGLGMSLCLKLAGVSLQDLRHAMAVHNPLTYTPKIVPNRVLIIGGAGDRFTPPRHLRLLHRHFTGSRLHWFPGNHLVHLHQARYLRLMKFFMDRHCGLAMKG
jgi:pimeloyl-ACP methyl ester carboxylesterase